MKRAAILACLLACSPEAAAPQEQTPPIKPVASIVAPVVSAAPKIKANETLAEHVARIHAQAIIVDGHNDIPSVLLDRGTNLDKPAPKSFTDLARMKTSGITGEFFSIYVDKGYAEKGGALRRALELIDTTYRQTERFPDDLVLATSVADIRRAKVQGKIGVLMGIEGGHAIENSLGSLRELYRLGCRYMTLTHTNTNDWADSSGAYGPPPVKHHGLTPFGEEVVKEMQRIGMLVDISHVSDETFFATIKVAKAPIIASHSDARAIANHRRNLTDEMLQALSKNGGVVMVNFWSMFLSNEFAADSAKWNEVHAKDVAELRKKYPENRDFYEALMKMDHGDRPKVTIAKLVDHIDHIVKVAGIDHVGLGSDFDGIDAAPEGLEGIDGLPKITEELVKRGYSDADILKILGENFLRAFGEIETYAKSTKTRLSADGDLTKFH